MQVAAGGHVPGQLLKFSVKIRNEITYVHVQCRLSMMSWEIYTEGPCLMRLLVLGKIHIS